MHTYIHTYIHTYYAVHVPESMYMVGACSADPFTTAAGDGSRLTWKSVDAHHSDVLIQPTRPNLLGLVTPA